MKECKALIFTEAGKAFGYGHLMRCVAIAQGLKEKGVQSFFYLRGNRDAGEILKKFPCMFVDWLKKEVNLKNKIVIIDSYHTERSFCRKVYDDAKIVLFLDDNNRVPYPGGIVLNGAPGAENIKYPQNYRITYLLGAKYLPLRQEFWKAPYKAIRKRVKKILITFGGSDTSHESLKMLRMLKEKYPNLEKRLIVGKWFSGSREICAESDKKNILICNPDSKLLLQEMVETDICISAGGQTVLELARLGVPTIAICFADNQVLTLKSLEKNGIIKFAGWHCEKDLQGKVCHAFEDLQSFSKRKNMSMAGKGCVDGRGVERLTQVLNEKGTFQKQNDDNFLKLRNVVMADCRDVWRWRNHPEVRNASFSKRAITYRDHRAWFVDKMRNPMVSFYIIENENKQKMAQVRFEKEKSNSAFININLNPVFFGRKLGGRIIKYSTRVFVGLYPEIKKVSAKILNTNIASQKAFKKAGYGLKKPSHTCIYTYAKG